MWPNSPPYPCAPLAVDEDTPADADLPEDADEVLEVVSRSLPVLRERGEVGLVVGMDWELGKTQSELVGHAQLRPPQIRGTKERACLCLDEPRERNGGTRRDQIACPDHGERFLRHPGQPAQHMTR